MRQLRFFIFALAISFILIGCDYPQSSGRVSFGGDGIAQIQSVTPDDTISGSLYTVEVDYLLESPNQATLFVGIFADDYNGTSEAEEKTITSWVAGHETFSISHIHFDGISHIRIEAWLVNPDNHIIFSQDEYIIYDTP